MDATEPVDLERELVEARTAMLLAFDQYSLDPRDKAKKLAVDEAYERLRLVEATLTEAGLGQSPVSDAA